MEQNYEIAAINLLIDAAPCMCLGVTSVTERIIKFRKYLNKIIQYG